MLYMNSYLIPFTRLGSDGTRRSIFKPLTEEDSVSARGLFYSHGRLGTLDDL